MCPDLYMPISGFVSAAPDGSMMLFGSQRNRSGASAGGRRSHVERIFPDLRPRFEVLASKDFFRSRGMLV